MAGPPSKIMIIRHAEKPPSEPNTEPLDVTLEGESGKGKSLIVAGWQRAGALNAFFAPYSGAPENSHVAKPDYIYAADPKGESKRPCETVTPLAAWLGYQQGTAQFNVSYEIGGGEKDVASSALALDGVVLICWEHDNIMPNLMTAIDNIQKIHKFKNLPRAWPDVFDLVWVLDWNSSNNDYDWTQTHQHLMAGDSAS